MPRLILSLTVMLVLSPPLYSAVVSGLYEAEVPVADQSSESYQDGLVRALRSVLVKLTGEEDVEGRQFTSYLLSNPQLYVQQYKYRSKAVEETDRLSLDRELYLWVRFNERALNQVFRDYQVPLWGKVRPNTLVWMLIEEDGQRSFVTLDDEEGLASALENRAYQRGIPLSYPLFDETDQDIVQETDVWGGFHEPVVRASRRYSPNAVLTGRVYQSEENAWSGRWTAIIEDRPVSWNATAENPVDLMSAVVDQLANLLASRYVQSPSGLQDSVIEVIVNDIYSYPEHARVVSYFSTLSNVSDVRVKSLQPGRVTLDIVTAGSDARGLRKTIQLGRLLEPVPGSDNLYRLR